MAKVGDFGVAEYATPTIKDHNLIAVEWLAPEVLDNSVYDHRSDVYSFAMVIWYIITRYEARKRSINRFRVAPFHSDEFEPFMYIKKEKVDSSRINDSDYMQRMLEHGMR